MTRAIDAMTWWRCPNGHDLAHNDEKDALAEALTSLAPLVRHGLQGANVPAGMDKPVSINTTDPVVEAAQIELVRRALSWVAYAHPEAVRSALARVTPPGWITASEEERG